MSAFRGLDRVERETRYLADYLASGESAQLSSLEAVLDRYVEMRLSTAEAMREAAEAWLDRPQWKLDAVREAVESELRSRLAEVAPLEHVRVRGYGGIRRLLFEYLALHPGEAVSLNRLRALTGDQVHTERRLRELRDLGLRLEARHASSEHRYVLMSEIPDLSVAFRSLAPKILRQVPGWSAARYAIALQEAEIS